MSRDDEPNTWAGPVRIEDENNNFVTNCDSETTAKEIIKYQKERWGRTVHVSPKRNY